jgi:hypothetical protein
MGKTPPSVRDIPAGLTGVVGMSMGYSHVLVIKSGGTVVAWGDTSSGQTKVPKGLKGVKAVAAGGYHSLALLSTGQIVGWGANEAGQSSPPPRPNSKYVWVAAGFKHSLAVGQLSPEAPKGVVVTPFDGAVTVTWSAPDDPGTTPITQYTVTAAPGGSTCTAVAVLSCTLGGLTDGTPYTFAVTAANSVGVGSPAVSLPTAPGVPALVTPEPEAPVTPSPAPTTVPGAGRSSGGSGGLPLPVLVVMAGVIGLAVAGLAYRPSLLVARVQEIIDRVK